jgi:hypothetical protein
MTLGVAVSRRSVTLVAVQRSGTVATVAQQRRIDRAPGTTIPELLRTLLAEFRNPRTPMDLAVALSLADVACGDAWTPPATWADAGARTLPALCETRCVSETLETLLLDVSRPGGTWLLVAMDRSAAQEIAEAAGGFRLKVLTAAPAALASAFGNLRIAAGGERIEIECREGIPSWRACPFDGPDEPGSVPWNGVQIPREQAAAFAAAVCEPDAVPNLLNAFPQHRKTFLKRFRDPLLNVGAAAALCLGAFGVQFHREAVRERDELAAARRAEMELWGRFLPTDGPREGRLLKAMRDRLADLGETSGAADIPSALAFWGEIGRQMPDPESLGLTLESLDLAPDGGRLSARVPASKDDPLKNASQLETRLNQSKKLAARGDYEVREGQVQVRLRMDYRP